MKLFTTILISIILLFGSITILAQDINQDTHYFDQPIDPELYLLRPGDKIDVIFLNSKLPPLSLTVNPEGKVIDQTLGIFDLTEKTLSQTKELLNNKLTSLFNVKEFVITISEPRPVTVSISGAVYHPGIYTAYTSDRVSGIIEKAGGIIPDGSVRWISFSGGPNRLIVDLDRAIYLNDYRANPCLYAGYAIYVPSKSDNVVSVAGEVNNPREIELVNDDTIENLILFAGGARSNADLDDIKIISKNKNSTSEALQSGDIILIPPRTQTAIDKKVAIFGAVQNPGFYEYTENRGLNDIVDQAGGFLTDANKELTTIFRKPRIDINGRVSEKRFPIANIYKSDNVDDAVTLAPEDSIYVPVNVGFVTVSGAVYNPGYFPYLKGKDALYFIKNAGGFLPTANNSEISILNPVSKITTMVSTGVLVSDGTEIIVNIREELK